MVLYIGSLVKLYNNSCHEQECESIGQQTFTLVGE